MGSGSGSFSFSTGKSMGSTMSAQGAGGGGYSFSTGKSMGSTWASMPPPILQQLGETDEPSKAGDKSA